MDKQVELTEIKSDKPIGLTVVKSNDTSGPVYYILLQFCIEMAIFCWWIGCTNCRASWLLIWLAK